MSDSPRTTQGFHRILPHRTVQSSSIADHCGKTNQLGIKAHFVCVLLMIFILATFPTTGCELLPELGMEDAAVVPEEAPPLSETSGAMVTSEAAPIEIEDVTEWPWLDHGAVIADPYEDQTTDAHTGEFLGRFTIARDGSYIDVVEAGENSALRFRVQGILNTLEQGELLDRYGRPAATFSRMDDGRYLVRAFGETRQPLAGEPLPPPIVGARRKQGTSPSTRGSSIIRYEDSHGVVHFMNKR